MGAVIGFPNEGIPGRIIVGRIMGEATEDVGPQDSTANHSAYSVASLDLFLCVLRVL